MKMVIVIIRGLHMRTGKMIAQGAHAAMIGFLGAPMETRIAWLNEHGMRKICVYVQTESELSMVCDNAAKAGVAFHKVTDRGDTEFHGVPTVTCAAIGPDTDERLDPITGGLKLL